MALVDEIVPYHMSHNAGGWLLAGKPASAGVRWLAGARLLGISSTRARHAGFGDKSSGWLSLWAVFIVCPAKVQLKKKSWALRTQQHSSPAPPSA
jgi:hypothetical protein